MISAQAALVLDQVTRVYRTGRTIGPVSLQVDQGEVLGLVGANGAGKTSLMRMICGLLAPTSGEVEVWGEAVTLGTPPPGLGALIEEPALYRWASARQHLQLTAAGRPQWVSHIGEVLEEVGLANNADQPVKSFSQGMRQRLGLARALLGQPRLLILDEPTNGLDPHGIRWLRDVLARRAQDGVCIVISSHQLSELQHVVGRAALISEGQLVRELDASALASSHGALEQAFFDVSADQHA